MHIYNINMNEGENAVTVRKASCMKMYIHIYLHISCSGKVYNKQMIIFSTLAESQHLIPFNKKKLYIE